jgi:hypothetical protein
VKIVVAPFYLEGESAMDTLLVIFVVIVGSLLICYATPNVGSEDEQPQKPQQ